MSGSRVDVRGPRLRPYLTPGLPSLNPPAGLAETDP